MIITRNAWILVGILLWGIPTGMIVALMVAINQTKNVAEGYLFTYDSFLSNLYVFTPVFAIIGLALGLIMFRISENLKKQPTPKS